MPNSTQEEKLRWIKPILEKRIKIKDMILVCPFSERSIKYWLSSYREHGLDGLNNKSRRPRSNPKETPIRIKERIIELRKDKELCARKLQWILLEEDIRINTRTIGKILKKEGLVRKYRTRKQQYRKPKSELVAGDLIEIDVKYVPEQVEGKQMYQFTAIDCATRWRFMKIYDHQSSYSTIEFLYELIKIFPYSIRAIKTDNASIFTNRYTGYKKSTDPFDPRIHQLDIECEKLGMKHYLIDPGKPAQNGRVERSHRSDQEHFYDKVTYETIEELQYKIKLWNMYYNDLQHCSLDGLSPNQALSLRVQNVCT